MKEMPYSPESLFAAESMLAKQHGLETALPNTLTSLRQQLQPGDDLDRMALWVAAPILASFARWLHHQIAQKPDAVPLCVMREGRFIGQLLHTLFGMETREIWLNRDLSLRAAFAAGDTEALLNWLVRTRIKPLTRGEATQILAGTTTNLANPDQPLDLPAAQKLMVEWEQLGFWPAIQTRATALSNRLLRHWQSSTGSTAKNFLLLDFATAGNIQRSLKTMLDAQNDNSQLYGLNFAMTAGSCFAADKGCKFSGFLAAAGQPEWIAAAYGRTPELIEIFTAPPLGALQDYAENGAPISAPPFLSPQHSSRLTSLQPMLIKAAQFYHQALGEKLTTDLARIIWGRLLLHPFAAEADALGDWPLDAGLDGRAARQLAPPLTGNPQSWSKQQTAWPAGSLLR